MPCNASALANRVGVFRILTGLFAGMAPIAAFGQQSLPAALAAPEAAPVVTVHAVGAQIYDCAPDINGNLAWRFREPIATLLLDGRTVGRHFAGPGWELADGSKIVGKAVANAPGATEHDIPWLKLEGIAGTGQFASVDVVQRINTTGGVLTGACDKVGEPKAVPYAADYVFAARPR